MLLADGMAALVGNYLQAVGTIAAVVVALFTQVYLVNRNRPALVVTLSTDLAEEDIAVLEVEPAEKAGRRPNGTSDDDGYLECILRVKVWAMPKKRSARDTQAILLQLRRPPSRTTAISKVPDGLFKWAGASYDEKIDIPTGTWRRLDILRYRQGANDATAILAPALNKPETTVRWPPGGRTTLPHRGGYTVEFAISCDEARPTFWRLEFFLDVPEHEVPRVKDALELNDRIRDVRLKRLSEPSSQKLAEAGLKNKPSEG